MKNNYILPLVKRTPGVLFLILILLNACEGPEGPRGINSLITTTAEPIGENCQFGGLKVESGLDNNENGILEMTEVSKTDYICSVEGTNSLINISDESEGGQCEKGGVKIDSGVDVDRNGTLDPAEVLMTKYLCHGSDGSTIEEVRFKLVTLTGLGSSSPTATTSASWQYLIQFNKNDFPEMTSATLVANVESGNANVAGIVDLFNIDQNQPIPGSEISSKSTAGAWVSSGNILNDLPVERNDLALRIRSGSNGTHVTVWQAYLILRKD